MFRILSGLALSVSMSLPGMSVAQPKDASGFPERTIRLIVPYVPGGLPDTMARILSQRMGDAFGRTVLVDNRPGAGGVIATEAVARAAPDGYTVLIADLGQTAITPAINPKLPYDILHDFAPVSLLGISAFFLGVHSSTGVTNLKEFVTYAKSRGGSMSYGSSGIGSPHHLAMETLRARLGVDLIHVPYKGSGQSVPALVANEVSALFISWPSAAAHVKAGTIRVLAVASPARTATAPDVPTFIELGVKDFVLVPSVAALAPAATPRAIVERLSAEMAKAVRHPDSVQRFAALGIEPVGSTPEVHAAQMKSDLQLFQQAVRVSGVKPE